MGKRAGNWATSCWAKYAHVWSMSIPLLLSLFPRTILALKEEGPDLTCFLFPSTRLYLE